MEKIKYFFRSVPDETVFQTFSKTHFAILAVVLLGSLFIGFNREALREESFRSRLRWFFILALSIQQTVLYSWYAVTGFSDITESLPLYHCRVAILCTVWGLLTDKKIAKSVGCLWGGAGSIAALLLPNPDPFFLPHFSFWSYFLGHGILLWASLYFLFVEELTLEKSDLTRLLLLSNIFHLAVYFIDRVISANYCYLIAPPFRIAALEQPFFQALYTPAVFFLFNLMIIIFYVLVSARRIAEGRSSSGSWLFK